MDFIIETRDRIKEFVSANEFWCIKLMNFLMLFIGLLLLNGNLGYQTKIDKWYIALAISLVSAFLPTGGGVFVMVLITEIHLFALSLEMAIVGAILFLFAYLLCGYYKSKDTYNFALIPTSYAMHIPFLGPMVSGLLRNVRELSSVICGALISYYLYVVKANASAILDETSEVTAISLVTNQILKSKMFYFYLVATIAMFLLVYFIRQADIKYPWLIGIGSGIAVEFIIMLTGCLISGEASAIPWLFFGNIIIAIVGCVLNLFFFSLDYTRIEKIQFEDDEYYYYVTAVPKVKIASKDKKIKRI